MKKTLLALAMLGSFGAAINAQAAPYAYAVAYDEISNLNMLPGSSGISILPSVINNSNALACLNGSCSSLGGAGIQDTPFAQVGTITVPGPYANNAYILPIATTHEANPTAFSVADADITSTSGLISSARNFAEAKLLGNSAANGSAGNSSIQSIQFTVGTTGGFFKFDFNAAPYLRAFVDAGTLVPTSALAALSASINIVGDQSNAVGYRGIVFNWAPDGTGGDGTAIGTSILGGFETRDSFTLNTSVTATTASPAPLDYNPTQCAAGTGPCFAAYTNNLVAGLYTLNVVMNENDSLLLNIPEPGSIMLLGIGLAALGGFTRRRSISPALPA